MFASRSRLSASCSPPGQSSRSGRRAARGQRPDGRSAALLRQHSPTRVWALPSSLWRAGRTDAVGTAYVRSQGGCRALADAEGSGEWVDPDDAGISFGNYAHQWLQDRVLKVRTRGLYEGLLRNHLNPTFDRLGLVDIDEAAVQVAKRAPRHWQGCRAHVQRGHGRQGIPAPALDSGNRSR